MPGGLGGVMASLVSCQQCRQEAWPEAEAAELALTLPLASEVEKQEQEKARPSQGIVAEAA